MKKNTLQKTIALALTGAMAMGTLAGCGSSNDTVHLQAQTQRQKQLLQKQQLQHQKLPQKHLMKLQVSMDTKHLLIMLH